jgi:hypothetical protein
VQFPTRNEVAHVPAGLSYWERGTFDLYRVNPPLGKMLAVLPALALPCDTACLAIQGPPGARYEWDVARSFATANAGHYFRLIGYARLAGIGWSVLAGWVIFRWASALYGERAGLLGSALWCLGPNVLAHAPLVTPDVPASVAGLVATYALWSHLRTGTWGSAGLAGLLLGVAQLTKFTLLVLYLTWLLLALAHARDPANAPYRALPWRGKLLRGAAVVLLSVFVVNLGYGFAGTGRPLGDYSFVSRAFRGGPAPAGPPPGAVEVGNRFRGSWVGRVPVPLPADYVLGIDQQKRDFESRWPSYLRGEWRTEGWWYYYLYALAVKVPLGAWGLGLWGLALTLTRHPASARPADELTLWLPAVVVLALVSSQTGFNHHSRYVLPALPFVAVATGKVAYFFDPKRWRAGLIAATLLGWSAISSLSVYPHSLSYFNELIGGPDRGHEHLIDSNIDWGQDLFFFQRWVERHSEARAIGLAYYNYIDYRPVLGVGYPAVPPDPAGPDDVGAGPHPGWWAVDVHSLKAVQDGRRTYFERFRPVAKAGYSIFIYHITPEEADQARHDMGLPPLEPPTP